MKIIKFAKFNRINAPKKNLSPKDVYELVKRTSVRKAAKELEIHPSSVQLLLRKYTPPKEKIDPTLTTRQRIRNKHNQN